MGLFGFLQKKKEEENNIIPSELQNIAKLLEEVKNTGTLPCRISSDILENLKIIANTPNWHLMLKGEIITNLNKIYDKWQNSLTVKNNNTREIQKTSTAGNFERRKYWEGTIEEYEEDLKNGLIDENTDVEIIKYTGSYIAMNNNGEIEEYME